MSLESVSLGALAFIVLSVGYMLMFNVEALLPLQEQYTETARSTSPSEDLEDNEDSRAHRQEILRLGGGVLFVVGALLFVTSMYLMFLVEPPHNSLLVFTF